MISKHRLKILIGFALVYIVIPVTSNFFALLFANYTSPQFLPKNYIQIFDGIRMAEDFLLTFISWAPFPIISAIITFYCYPIIRSFKNPSTYRDKSELVKNRILNSPFVISLLGMIGWEISTALSILRIYFIFPNLSEQTLILLFFIFAYWGFFVFAFSFFTIEYLNRIFIIPEFFPDGGLGKYANKARFSIIAKHILLWISASLFPSLLLLFGLMNRSELNIYDMFHIFETDVLFQLAFVLLILSLLITYVLAKSIHNPLRKMESATYKIKDQKFDTRVIIHSSDELGVLGDAINEMTKGLEEKEKIKDTFGRIVDPRIRDYLLANDQMLGGKTVEATILFSDLRDFTKLSENRTPTQVLHILNRYFQEMSNAVETHGGFINKFIGDAILAIFGTPMPLEEPEDTAIITARTMAQNLISLNKEFESEGLPTLRMGIGIHVGQVLAGNIGSVSRMEYTVIGDTVNIASRVEGLCKGTGKDLLITEACYMRLSEKTKGFFQYLGEYELKGRNSREKLYF